MLYQKLGVPGSEECPDCRRQRRLMFRNFFNLYHRTCDLTSKKIISMYDKDTPFPVYDMHDWWSDKWDAGSYGLEIDWNIPFFEQIRTLHRTVPRMSIVNSNCENTDYCNMSFQSRNCYLVFGNVGNEDCSYGHIVWQSKDCYDCLYVYRSQLCYECIDCVQCYGLSFCRDCDNCSDCMFCIHCIGCRNCFGCTGLNNKEYCLFNEQLTQDEYERRMKDLNTGSQHILQTAHDRVQQLIGKEVVKYYHGFNCENVTGDYLYNCRNVYEGYDLKNCEDCRYGATLESFTDSMDCNFCPAKSELCYQCVAVDGHRLLSCHNCLSACANLSYCDNCYSCKDCFGCIGMKNKQFCILNKQYTEEEYKNLLPKLIDRMRQSDDYGQFFPYDCSPFGYNETIANEYFPLTKEEVEARGWRWKEKDANEERYMGPVIDIPDDIRDVPEDITNGILRCEKTGKLFKIIPQELAFLKNRNLALPRLCWEERLRQRFAVRNPRHLWNRACTNCQKPIQTTYSPDRPEIVYCEECYLQTVY